MSWQKVEFYRKALPGTGHYDEGDFDRKLFEKWIEGKGIATWMSGIKDHDVPKLLHTGRNNLGNPSLKSNYPPNLYSGIFFKATKPLKVWLVIHSYCDIESIRRETEEWTVKNGLTVNFYDKNESWYGKGKCITIVITTI